MDNHEMTLRELGETVSEKLSTAEQQIGDVSVAEIGRVVVSLTVLVFVAAVIAKIGAGLSYLEKNIRKQAGPSQVKLCLIAICLIIAPVLLLAGAGMKSWPCFLIGLALTVPVFYYGLPPEQKGWGAESQKKKGEPVGSAHSTSRKTGSGG